MSYARATFAPESETVVESNVTVDRRETVAADPKDTPTAVDAVVDPVSDTEIVVDDRRNDEPVKMLMAALKRIPAIVLERVDPPFIVIVDDEMTKLEKPSTVTVVVNSIPVAVLVPDEVVVYEFETSDMDDPESRLTVPANRSPIATLLHVVVNELFFIRRPPPREKLRVDDAKAAAARPVPTELNVLSAIVIEAPPEVIPPRYNPIVVACAAIETMDCDWKKELPEMVIDVALGKTPLKATAPS